MEHNWILNPTQEDPLTHKQICYMCWHRDHKEGGCQNVGCDCLCIEEAQQEIVQRKERSARRRERRKMKRAMLENSPLKSLNPMRIT